MEWPPTLNKRDEKLRAAHGLTIKGDGWYKWLEGKVRYIAKPMPLADALTILDAKRRSFTPADRPPRRVTVSRLTVQALADLFLADCWERVKTGKPKKMSRRTFEDYEATLAKFCAVVGLTKQVADLGPDDFTAFIDTIRTRADTSIRREMIYIDRMFNWAGPGRRGMNLIEEVRPGPNWIHPEGVGEKDKAYTFAQLRQSHAAASAKPMLLAAWHLGFGSGFIPSDLATLREDQIDWQAGVIIFPKGRGKTGIDRQCALHPSALAALREYMRGRKSRPTDAAVGLVFRTIQGTPLAKWYEGETRSYESNALKRPWRERVGLPFTGLRTTLASLLDDWPDQRAVDVILGHKSTERAKHIRTVHYAKQFNPERARKAVDHAYALVFGESGSPPAPPPIPARRKVHRAPRGGTRASGQGRPRESGSGAASRPAVVRRSSPATARPG